jgi:DNA-binding NtrC family response regulator
MPEKRILIVDDEENILKALQRALIDEDYTIETAQNGMEALEILKMYSADVVLSDNMMPGISGLDLLQQIKQLYPNIIGILITGRSDVKITIAAINQGEIFRFLLKPWDDEELKMTLRIAFQYHDLIVENKKLAATVKQQSSLLEEIEKKYPGITKVARAEDGTIQFEDEDFNSIVQPFQVKE